MDILQKSLTQMKQVFSSNEFTAKAKRNGLSDAQVRNGAIANFLHQYARQYGSRRTWIKRTDNAQPNPHFGTPITNDLDLRQAIAIIKKHGYKILMPTTEWKEL